LQALLYSSNIHVRLLYLNDYSEEGIDEDTILDVYFKQIQVSWALIFGKLSKLWFDRCLKFMN
jgi:hypothetical protein